MSTAKINQKEMDAFFEFLKQPIPAESPSARVLPADEHAPEPAMDDGYYDDEPLWSDTQTRIEQMNSIKGR